MSSLENLMKTINSITRFKKSTAELDRLTSLIYPEPMDPMSESAVQ